MATIIIKPANREEWLKEREKGIGSSEVGTILGVNPWETPYQLWRRKLGIDPPIEQNFAMTAGHYLEDAVSMFWQDETGLDVIKSSAGDWLFVDTEHEHRRASPDRTYWLPNSTRNGSDWKQKGILECKTTRMSIDGDNLPKMWFCQLQYQLGVGDLNEGSIAWLIRGSDFDYRTFNFDPEFYGWMIEEVDKFWIDNIKGKKEPAAVNADDVAIKYNRHVDGKVIQANTHLLQIYDDLVKVRAEIKELDTKKKEYEDTLKMSFGDAEILEYGEQTLATWKAPKESARFNEKAFKADNPEIWEKYRNPYQGGRRFLIK